MVTNDVWRVACDTYQTGHLTCCIAPTIIEALALAIMYFPLKKHTVFAFLPKTSFSKHSCFQASLSHLAHVPNFLRPQKHFQLKRNQMERRAPPPHFPPASPTVHLFFKSRVTRGVRCVLFGRLCPARLSSTRIHSALRRSTRMAVPPAAWGELYLITQRRLFVYDVAFAVAVMILDFSPICI